MRMVDDLTGIKVYIAFEEALFRMHLTKAFRDTYLAPLPTTVAGMFGAMLGLRREEVFDSFNGFLFGSKLLSYKGKSKEYGTLLQLKSSRAYVSTQIPMYILVEPEYEIVIAGNRGEIEDIYSRFKDGLHYLPYGGSSDYLATDIKILDVIETEMSSKIGNYAPIDLVDDVRLERNGELSVATVKMKGCVEAKDFYFVYRGELLLNRDVISLDDIGLYSLDDFCYRLWSK